MLLFDAHLDLSLNAIAYNRDLRRPVEEIRIGEHGMSDLGGRAHGTVAFPEMREAGIGLCVATQLAGCMKPAMPMIGGWNSPEQAWAMTGGRNISLSYYGLHADGSQDPTAFNDMDTAPRLLLGKEYGEQWRDKLLKDNELKSDLVESQQWRGMVNHPRIKIYQTGRLDSVLLGGDTHYGKLHAKFLIGADDIGFVGTSNFDDRSKLYNNEMGYFFESADLVDDLLTEFELLKSQSYLWGSPEWLQMRQQMRATKSAKGKWTKRQRSTFRRLYASGLHWQF